MRTDTRQIYEERITRVLLHIQRHIDEPLELERLARVAHFSPFHFHRIFTRLVGETVAEHVRRLRLERAAARLKYTRDPVTRIAFDSGYETHESFLRAFRTLFGEVPSAYRRRRQPAAVRDGKSNIRRHVAHIRESIQQIQLGGSNMEARLENIPAMRLAFVRHTGPYSGCKGAWEKLMAWAGPRGLVGPQTVCLGICHDDPAVTPQDKLRYDACITVGPDVTPGGEVGITEAGGGRFAVAIHRGPYDNLGDTWTALCAEWIPANNLVPRMAPCFEIYRNDAADTPAADLITEVCEPVE